MGSKSSSSSKKYINNQLYEDESDDYLAEDRQKTITKVFMYQSPIQENILSKVSFLKHLEIIIQINYIEYMVISFSQNGLQTEISYQIDRLSNRREDNFLKLQKQVKVKFVQVKKFIKQHDDKPYSLTSWNCRDYTNQLWKRLS